MDKRTKCSVRECKRKSVAIGWLSQGGCLRHKRETDQIQRRGVEGAKQNPKAGDEMQAKALEKEHEKLVKKLKEKE